MITPSRILLLTILLVVSASCKSKKEDATKKVLQPKSDIQVRAKFIHKTSIPNQQLSRTNEPGNIETLRDEYLYFNLQLERADFGRDKKTTDYLDFGIEKDFRLASGIDTLMPVLVHRLANGRKEVYEYIVAFENDDEIKNKHDIIAIIYDDKLFGLGQQVFSFQMKDILMLTDKTN
jgi:hypothetical protein